jgi:hypothetical protein
VDEQSPSVEWLGGGQGSLQGAPGGVRAGGGPFVDGSGERGLQQESLHEGVRKYRGYGSVEDRAHDRTGAPTSVAAASVHAHMNSNPALPSVRSANQSVRVGSEIEQTSPAPAEGRVK